VPLLLFGFAPETEVREQTPVLVGADFVEQNGLDSAGRFRELAFLAYGVLQDNPEENEGSQVGSVPRL
jgi:hypothetical protein